MDIITKKMELIKKTEESNEERTVLGMTMPKFTSHFFGYCY